MQREKVETLIAEDKALEKGFKKEFAETEGHLQALFNLFKRRTVARNTSPAAQAQVPPPRPSRIPCRSYQLGRCAVGDPFSPTGREGRGRGGRRQSRGHRPVRPSGVGAGRHSRARIRAGLSVWARGVPD